MIGRLFRHLLIPGLLLAPALAGAAETANGTDWLLDNYDIELTGFAEIRGGLRLQDDPFEKDASLSEARLRLEANRDFGGVDARLKGDLGYDAVRETDFAELREASLSFSPANWVDIRLGRQVVTWGTGDMLFINDVFAKDWESFFIGRDDEYLKKPSDALRIGLFSEAVNLDLVYQPRFTPSRFIDGSRLSYWNGPAGRVSGRDRIFDDHEPNRFFRDQDLALRLSRNFDGIEYALYGYRGFWSTPEGLDPADGRLIYPKLAVWGGSVRGPVLGGIGNIELGYYDSLDDRAGTDPLIRNSELRLLIGHERELAPDLTGGFQYYLERKTEYDGYLASLPPGSPAGDRNRHLLTLRLTQLLLQQNLRLSFFAYWSPSDHDAYLRPKAHYELSDFWAVEAGANIFLGRDRHSFWGQFEDNSNACLGLRRSF